MEAREIAQRLDFCLRVGEVLLSNGAGAADVHATMGAVASAVGVPRAQIDLTFTSLAMNVADIDDEGGQVVQMRQVTHREIDYEDLTKVDRLVRDVVSAKVELTDARRQLARIVSSGHSRPRWSVTLGYGALASAVTVMLGGGPVVMLVAFAAACGIDRLQYTMMRRRVPYFYQQVAGGAFATVLAAVATQVLGNWFTMNASLVVAASIILMLAGIGFVGAIQDALSGFYVTGNARLLEALIATAGIIAGVTGGLSLAKMIGFGLPAINIPNFSLVSLLTLSLGAAVAAATFAWSSYAPKRILAPVAGLGAASAAIAQTLQASGFGRPWSVALAAFAVGLLGYSVSGRFKVPPLVTVVSAVVPLLPGLSIYQGLFLLGDEGGQRVGAGLLALFTAVSVAIAIAAGVILGETIAQPVKREARKVETRLAGPRLVGVTRVRRRRSAKRWHSRPGE
ncbi:threonine/serine ThrE exporter family protein [Nocardioides panacisoli]|uniref:threonine/serine ThrE exporter family protein n=1 Tax=Nocardioides panacisoli TaxID=627624 RepID=UPI001F37B4AC|nr:threonine/serine exporter family protein [Nocardioides panacisoli]